MLTILVKSIVNTNNSNLAKTIADTNTNIALKSIANTFYCLLHSVVFIFSKVNRTIVVEKWQTH